MVMIGLRGLVVLLVLGLVNGAFQGGDICSTQCATYDCNDWSSSGCNGKCYSWWTWDANINQCSFTDADQKQIMDTTYDEGGNMYVDPDPQTFACDFSSLGSGAGNGYTYFGAYTANQVVSVKLDLGIFVAHYQLDLYFNFIIQDKDSNDGWGGNPKLTVN